MNALLTATHEERIALAQALTWDVANITPDDVGEIISRLGELGFELRRADVQSSTGVTLESAMDAAWRFAEKGIQTLKREHGLLGVWSQAFRLGWNSSRAFSSAPSDPDMAGVRP